MRVGIAPTEVLHLFTTHRHPPPSRRAAGRPNGLRPHPCAPPCCDRDTRLRSFNALRPRYPQWGEGGLPRARRLRDRSPKNPAAGVVPGGPGCFDKIAVASASNPARFVATMAKTALTLFVFCRRRPVGSGSDTLSVASSISVRAGARFTVTVLFNDFKTNGHLLVDDGHGGDGNRVVSGLASGANAKRGNTAYKGVVECGDLNTGSIRQGRDLDAEDDQFVA